MEIIVIVLICFLVFYGISEIFGRSKHIGRGWSFALLATSFIFGIIALILSPSAKDEPTNGNQNHQVFGWISIGLGLINLIVLNPLAIGFIVLGFYLIELSKGKVQNKNPKFYFTKAGNETETVRQKFSNNLKNLKQNQSTNNFPEYLYYIIEDNQESEPLSVNELKSRKITENTYVWRKGLTDWTKANEVDELKNIIIYSPPPFNPHKNHDKINQSKTDNKKFIIANKSFSLQDIKREFEDGNYFIDKKTIIFDQNGSEKLISEIPELSFLLDYFPPTYESY